MAKIISFLLIFFIKKQRFLPKFKNFQNFDRTKTGFLKIFGKKLAKNSVVFSSFFQKPQNYRWKIKGQNLRIF